MLVLRKSLDYYIRIIWQLAFLGATSLLIAIVLSSVPSLIIPVEAGFLIWFSRHKLNEYRAKKSLRNEKYQFELLKKQKNYNLELKFAESRLYRLYTKASYQSSYGFVKEQKIDWAGIYLQKISRFYELAGEEIPSELEETIRSEDKFSEFGHLGLLVSKALNHNKVEFSRYSANFRYKDFMEELCKISKGKLELENFDVSYYDGADELNSRRQVIEYKDEEIEEEVVVESIISNEKRTKTLEFFNKILKIKGEDYMYFAGKKIHFIIQEQAEYLTTELRDMHHYTAYGKLCVISPDRLKAD